MLIERVPFYLSHSITYELKIVCFQISNPFARSHSMYNVYKSVSRHNHELNGGRWQPFHILLSSHCASHISNNKSVERKINKRSAVEYDSFIARNSNAFYLLLRFIEWVLPRRCVCVCLSAWQRPAGNFLNSVRMKSIFMPTMFKQLCPKQQTWLYAWPLYYAMAIHMTYVVRWGSRRT